jgi:hypothetical protein
MQKITDVRQARGANMTTINVDCRECGVNNTVPAGALLAAAGTDDLPVDFAGMVYWICEGCDEVVSAPVAWSVFLQLIGAGVRLIEEGLESTRPPHPEHPCDSQAFTPDDLLELHELLATDNWFGTLAATRT